MNIAGLVKTSTVDFPGQLAAVVFTAGCNLDCFYCHNRPLLTGSAPRIDEQTVLGFLRKRQGLLDGVVFSGGEPTLQQDLPDFIRLVRQLGYKVKLDSNGTRPSVLRHLLADQLLDYVAVDYKAPWRRYPEICDCPAGDVEAVQATFRLLKTATVAWEARITVIPQLDQDDLTEMARSLPPAPVYVLQRYVRPTLFRAEDRFRIEAASSTPAQLVLAAEQLRRYQPGVIVR